MTFDEMLDESEIGGLVAAATLFTFAKDVLWDAHLHNALWVVRRAIDRAEKELRNAVDQGDDMNIVDARMAALRLRLGICEIRDILAAGSLAHDAIGDACGRASQILREAAKECWGLALDREAAA
jgi:hypothetical protein